jgi:5'-methylthioadenosine phosphorylase
VSAGGSPHAEIGIFGGSGFYSLFDSPAHTVELETPYGAPAGPVTFGEIGGRSVAFLARHGAHHQLVPHQVPARANLWAMRTLGVQRIIGPCAAGSLARDVHPGDFVVLDQLVDRTWGRPDTYYDQGQAHHVSFADPYCPELRAAAAGAAHESGIVVHERGTVVVIQGPRFATRAESHWYRAQGWEVINMTQYPEAYLARELGICYCGIALITDYDIGVDDDPGVEPVSQEQVFAFFEANLHRVRELLARVIPALPATRAACGCADALGPLLH